MHAVYRHSGTSVWLLLVVLTGVAWWMSVSMPTGDGSASRTTTVQLFVLAFFKVRLVIMHFMEIKTAPWQLRLLFDAWVVIVCAVTTGLYWFL